jgi:hypothetical protein
LGGRRVIDPPLKAATMKSNLPKALLRALVLMPAVSLMLAPLAAGARDREESRS